MDQEQEQDKEEEPGDGVGKASPRLARAKKRPARTAAGRSSTSGQLWPYDASPHRWFGPPALAPGKHRRSQPRDPGRTPLRSPKSPRPSRLPPLSLPRPRPPAASTQTATPPSSTARQTTIIAPFSSSISLLQPLPNFERTLFPSLNATPHGRREALTQRERCLRVGGVSCLYEGSCTGDIAEVDVVGGESPRLRAAA